MTKKTPKTGVRPLGSAKKQNQSRNIEKGGNCLLPA